MTFSFRFLMLCFSTVFVNACTDNTNKKSATQDTTLQTKSVVQQKYSDKTKKILNKLIWTTDFDTAKHDFVLIKNREVNPDTLIPQKIIDEINSVEASIFLQLEKVSHDTIYVSIPDSYYLTERIGTSGASNYMAYTTFSLTELKGIKYVHYDFEEGEHLSPGTMTRNNYKNYR
ncbi:MAG: hypothetical protein INR73_00400 [Williamsia sp.]|nr:hypothetical protein [Williamsia sp.]